jgi:hypothetical protein
LTETPVFLYIETIDEGGMMITFTNTAFREISPSGAAGMTGWWWHYFT